MAASAKRRAASTGAQYVKWSPQGSMLATFHNKGIALWGDSDFNKQGRLAHNGVGDRLYQGRTT